MAMVIAGWDYPTLPILGQGTTCSPVARKQGHSQFPDAAGGGGLAEAEATGGARTNRGSDRPGNEETPYGATVRNLAGRAAPEV